MPISRENQPIPQTPALPVAYASLPGTPVPAVPTGLRELGVIDRYASLISTLDSSLEAHDADAFLRWLGSQGAFGASVSPAREEGGAGERARVEKLLLDAEACLEGLVADKQEVVFRDRGEGGASTPLELPEEELYEVRRQRGARVACCREPTSSPASPCATA